MEHDKLLRRMKMLIKLFDDIAERALEGRSKYSNAIVTTARQTNILHGDVRQYGGHW